MRLEPLPGGASTSSPLRRADPRILLVGVVAFAFAVVATPLGRWRLLAAEGLFLAFFAGLAGVSPRDLLRRWAGFVLLVGFLAILVAPSHPARARIGMFGVAAGLLVKNSLAFLAVLTLTAVVPFPSLLGALRRLGMPPVLVATLHFMYRYLHVFAEELDRMAKARLARNFRRSGRLGWGLLTGLIGILFLRSMERGERVHAAMLARGWDGVLRSLDGPDLP